ncbi:MAG: M48 family metallopeptidase [Methylophaga sp.]|nr:M48 family metallopeptidase [Methylophaga sp.]
MTSHLHAHGIEIAVKRSHRRKTMALKVHNGEVSIHLPGHCPLRIAEDFIASKSGWINARLAEQQQQPTRSFADGSLQPLFGKYFPIKVIAATGRRQQLDFDGQTLHCQLTVNHTDETDQVKSLLKKFYRQQAAQQLIQRCQVLAEQYQLSPRQITVRQYRSRWGSCRSNGDIQLNWQLIQAPQPIIDYVITHELCHLQYLNHSPSFWNLVARFDADYRQHRQWLKQHGHHLIF